jgi:hypothetical protein
MAPLARRWHVFFSLNTANILIKVIGNKKLLRDVIHKFAQLL